jgi:hypothetical protein
MIAIENRRLGQLLTIDLLEDKRQKIVRKIKIVEDQEVVAKSVAKMAAGNVKQSETEEIKETDELEVEKVDEIDDKEGKNKTDERKSVENESSKIEVAVCIESIDLQQLESEIRTIEEATPVAEAIQVVEKSKQ